MKLLIYLLLLLTMPLAAQGKTDEKTLLDRIDKMIENDLTFPDFSRHFFTL